MLSYYLKEVLGVRSFVLPLDLTSTSTTEFAGPAKLWIVSDQSLEARENDLLEKMLKSVKMEMKSFKILSLEQVSKTEIQNQDYVLWFSDSVWSGQSANIIALPAFHHFFDLEGDELKNIKKSTWEKLKIFAAEQN